MLSLVNFIKKRIRAVWWKRMYFGGNWRLQLALNAGTAPLAFT